MECLLRSSNSQPTSRKPKLCCPESWKSVSQCPGENYAIFMDSHTSMLHVSPLVCFGFQLRHFLPWVLLCLQVSQVSSTSQQHKYNGFQESRVKDTIKSTIGDIVDQLSMNLPIHEDIKLFMEKDIKMNGNDITTSNTISNSKRQHTCTWQMQEEGCWQHRGGSKLQVQSRSIHDESSFEDWGYEVMTQHEDHAKAERAT